MQRLQVRLRRRRSPKRQAQHMAFLALFALALVMPAFTKNFVMFQLTLTMVYAIAIVGLNLLTGFNGQFSLGHSAFFAVGAYHGGSMLMEHAEMSYVWTLPIAGVICFVFGFMLGLSGAQARGRLLRAPRPSRSPRPRLKS